MIGFEVVFDYLLDEGFVYEGVGIVDICIFFYMGCNCWGRVGGDVVYYGVGVGGMCVYLGY